MVLGILQGLAEFLPISSSAHLTLAPWVFGWEDPGLAFDVALHAGTLVALAWYFRSDWIELFIAGKLLNNYAEQAFRSPQLIACTLMVMGVLLWAADKWGSQRRTLEQVSMRDAVLIGLAQVCALIPGVSRSGSTMTAGRALGLNRASAARFSFLMSLPITAAAVAVKLPEAVRAQSDLAPMIVGIVTAAVSGWIAISVLLKLLAKHSFGIFALYRLALGIFILVLFALRA